MKQGTLFTDAKQVAPVTQTRPRKPKWLSTLCKQGNARRFHEVKCSCGAWVIEERPRRGAWEKWDPYAIQGDDEIAIARILGRTLCVIGWDPVLQCACTVTLPTPLTSSEECFASHECERPPLTIRAPTLAPSPYSRPVYTHF